MSRLTMTKIILIGLLSAEIVMVSLIDNPFKIPDVSYANNTPAINTPTLPVLNKENAKPSFAVRFTPTLVTAPKESIFLTTPRKTTSEPETNAFVVFFDFDSALLNSESEAAIDAAANAAREGQEIRIFATAHTDSSGSNSYNLELSRKRAEQIQQAFIDRGINLERIDIHAVGEERPRVSTPEGLPDHRNRRVEIIVGPAPNI